MSPTRSADSSATTTIAGAAADLQPCDHRRRRPKSTTMQPETGHHAISDHHRKGCRFSRHPMATTSSPGSSKRPGRSGVSRLYGFDRFPSGAAISLVTGVHMRQKGCI